MSLPDVEWSTNYPGSQDPDDNSKQPDVVNESSPGAGDGHNTRASQILALRNKLQAACKLIGDNNRLPATSIMKRVWDLETSPPASPPSGAASGQLSGTYPGPSVAGITETDGPTALTIGAIADGKFLKRSGSDIVGADDTTGATVFTELTDAFSSYTDKALASLRVKSGEDGIESLKHNLSATSDPTVNDGADDGYEVSSLWFRVDAGNEKVFICLKNTDPDQAIWQDVGGGGASSLDTAYDGGDNITVDGNPVTLNRSQSADDQKSLEIVHDFNSSQGSAVVITGANSGDGTADGEAINAISVAVEKKVPASTTMFVMGSSDVRSKHGESSWFPDTLPGGTSGLECIKGSGTVADNVWICGGIGNTTGYLAVDDGTGFARVGSGGAHPTFGTHPYDGQPAENGMEWVWPISKEEIWTVTYTWPSGNRYHKWDPTNGWVEKHVAAAGGGFELVSVGTYFALGQNDGNIIYSSNSGEDWATDATFAGNWVRTRPNPATGKIVVITRSGGTARVWEGYPGGSWNLLNDFVTGWGSVDFKGAYVSEDGAIFTTIASGGSSKFVHSWTTTPVDVNIDDWSGSGMWGASSGHVIFYRNTSSIYIWDGASLSSEAHGGSSSTISTWAFIVPTGTGTFSGLKVSFTGSTGSNDAAAFEVGGGATHALKAVSGDIELNNGVVILGEQVETPETPTDKGVFYTKEVGGETEAFYLDTAGNEVQVTSGGAIQGTSFGREQTWSSPGTDVLGDPIVFNDDTALAATPIVAANMAAGYDIQAYINGVRMIHNNPPAATKEFYYNSATNKVELYASGGIDRYDVVYRSQS